MADRGAPAARAVALALVAALAACATEREAQQAPHRSQAGARATSAAQGEETPAPDKAVQPAAPETGSGSGAPQSSGTPESPDGAPRAGDAASPDSRSTPALLAAAADGVTTLAHLHGHEAHQQAAEILRLLTTLAARADPDAAPVATRDLTLAAERLEAPRSETWFAYTDAVRQGLGAALDLLEPQASSTDSSWIQTARAAVRAIRPASPFDLEHAAIQDAYRSVVDAFRAVL
jgi:hypothetical protein